MAGKHRKGKSMQEAQLRKMSKVRLLALLALILAILGATKRLTKAQRKSLAITERQLKIREKVLALRGEKMKGSAAKKSKKSKSSKARRGKGSRSRKRSSKLGPGIHRVTIKGRSRKVRVLPNGRWRFMKG